MSHPCEKKGWFRTRIVHQWERAFHTKWSRLLDSGEIICVKPDERFCRVCGERQWQKYEIVRFQDADDVIHTNLGWTSDPDEVRSVIEPEAS